MPFYKATIVAFYLSIQTYHNPFSNFFFAAGTGALLIIFYFLYPAASLSAKQE
jgi:hypothetical protein